MAQTRLTGMSRPEQLSEWEGAETRWKRSGTEPIIAEYRESIH